MYCIDVTRLSYTVPYKYTIPYLYYYCNNVTIYAASYAQQASSQKVVRASDEGKA